MRHIETAKYIRISKTAARKLYNENGQIYICPCNVNPDSDWDLMMGPVNTVYPFDDMVFWSTFYNCDSKRGSYLAFYIKKGGATE